MVTVSGWGAGTEGERPLYGPQPTQPTHARDAYATRHARGGGQPHNTTKSSYRVILALPAQSSRWSQRQGNARHPSRTRKLSLTAPMVLHPPGCGRVGHHRAHTTQSARNRQPAAPGQLHSYSRRKQTESAPSLTPRLGPRRAAAPSSGVVPSGRLAREEILDEWIRRAIVVER